MPMPKKPFKFLFLLLTFFVIMVGLNYAFVLIEAIIAIKIVIAIVHIVIIAIEALATLFFGLQAFYCL